LQNGSAQNVPYATPPSRIQVTSNKRGTGQSKVTTKVLTSHTVLTDTLTAQNLIATVSVGTAVTIAVPNAAASGSTINIVTQGTSGIATPKLDANGSAVGISYTANANTGGKTDTVSYTLTSACTSSSSSCAVTTSNVATVTITITGAAAPAPAPGVVETITVTAASYRADQKRWTISGTDNVSNNQVLTIKNLGTIAAPKNDVIGTASVVAGAWTLDVRGVAPVAVAGDRIVAVNISAGISSPERPMLSANIR
jgi:hypothetical protein